MGATVPQGVGGTAKSTIRNHLKDNAKFHLHSFHPWLVRFRILDTLRNLAAYPALLVLFLT